MSHQTPEDQSSTETTLNGKALYLVTEAGSSDACAARLSHRALSSNVVGQRLSLVKLKSASFMAGVALGQKLRRVKLVSLPRTQYTGKTPNRRGLNALLLYIE